MDFIALFIHDFILKNTLISLLFTLQCFLEPEHTDYVFIYLKKQNKACPGCTRCFGPKFITHPFLWLKEGGVADVGAGGGNHTTSKVKCNIE